MQALARLTAKRSGHQTIPHASVSEIAEALGHRDVDVVQTALEKALADGYIAEHPEYHGMYYMTETGEGLMDTAALNG